MQRSALAVCAPRVLDEAANDLGGHGIAPAEQCRPARVPFPNGPLTVVGGASALASFGAWVTGSVAAVPAALGLVLLAHSDVRTHRISLRTLWWCAASTLTCLAAEAAITGDWRRAGLASVLAAVAMAAALGLWIVVPGVAFGDVLLLGVTIVLPAWLGTRAVTVTLVGTFIVAGALALFGRRNPPGVSRTIAMAPALLAGWVLGLVAG